MWHRPQPQARGSSCGSGPAFGSRLAIGMAQRARGVAIGVRTCRYLVCRRFVISVCISILGYVHTGLEEVLLPASR